MVQMQSALLHTFHVADHGFKRRAGRAVSYERLNKWYQLRLSCALSIIGKALGEEWRYPLVVTSNGREAFGSPPTEVGEVLAI